MTTAPTSPPEPINWKRGDLILVEHVTVWLSNAATGVKSGQSSEFWFGTVVERLRDGARHVPRVVRRLDNGRTVTIAERRKERRSGIERIVAVDRHDHFWHAAHAPVGYGRSATSGAYGWPKALHATFPTLNDAKVAAVAVLFGSSTVG